MGLSSSKHNASGPSPPASSSSSGPVVGRSRSGGSRVLKSSCLGSHHADNDERQASDCPGKENGKTAFSPSENKSGSCRVSAECYSTDKAEESDETNCINSGIELREWGESSFTSSVSRDGTSSRDFSSRSLNPPSRFLSRFSFYPGNLSFRLTRGNSLSSTRSYPASSTGFTISNEEEEYVGSSSSVNRNDRPQGCDFFPACFTNRSPRTQDGICAANSSPDFNRQLSSGRDVLRNRDNTRVDCGPHLFSPINHINSDDGGIRHAERRSAAREPVDRNVRFSRTLSVGRLRDRVLQRTPVADLDLSHFQEEREVRLTRRIDGRRGIGHPEVEATSDDNNFTQQISSDNVSASFSDTFYGSQNNVHGIPRTRETRYRDLLEHRSNFLERRRRIRSQVRALQRLGSRFENLSGHERSCILSGQHRGGHCTCRISAREANSNDDANARASISRIVMLAEALFEVLDEIHQQSVVLSSRPSVSPIGSVPAPNEVVDSLPLKIFSKFKRKPCDDGTQCYICLVEYDDGDTMRILPCRHEFHRACIDKWLKEIHRVCPLCRGDVCRPDPITAGS
ncbi:Anaphase-promoting complex (APC), subunit 11 [Handroanthus impetiginosus]|uniref:Anaphase-promoting complex (APC), subunit 11 n=1 Tax=Handroanthus impetiginosus TaxID=429701 RepID=A0A2G9I941_9LAMI|nr:Anaphase-promoting complex (APC), subunit 11 [Handroanthus impetiginosus]